MWRTKQNMAKIKTTPLTVESRKHIQICSQMHIKFHLFGVNNHFYIIYLEFPYYEVMQFHFLKGDTVTPLTRLPSILLPHVPILFISDSAIFKIK